MVELAMLIDLDDLPSDPELLHRLVRDMAAVVESRDGRSSACRRSSGSSSGRSSAAVPNGSIPTNWRWRSKTLTPILAISGKAVRWSPSPPPNGRPTASRCPITCRARMSFSMSRTPCARAAGVLSMPSARASARCSTGFPRSSASSGSRGPNTPAGPMRRSFSMKHQSGRSPAGWPRPRCWRSAGLQIL